MKALAPVLATTIVAHVINGPETLEPSVLNEVEHALAAAPAETNAVSAAGDVFATNGLPAAEVAIRLVSLQRGDGRWLVNGTNFTAEAVRILESVSGLTSHVSRPSDGKGNP